jgi:small-conductance mechanosensitive channel
MIENFFAELTKEIIISIILVIILIIWRFTLKKSANRIARMGDFNIGRTKLMFKYINVLVSIVMIFALMFTWGVEAKDLVWVFSSVFAVIGIGLFAIWSILSNVTSGVIMFFSCPFKIGDYIKIHDKEHPIEGKIEDIKAFQMHLRTRDGELIVYPNNLVLQKPISLLKKENE